jgi:Xaa-Pro aminopeptidase
VIAISSSQRLGRVRVELERARADWLVVGASADFRWLTGAPVRATERLVAFALPREGDPFGVIGRLEADGLRRECPWLDLEVWDDGEDPFPRLARRLELDRRPGLLVGEGFRTETLLRLAAAAACRPAAPALAGLRAVKEPEELRLMREAAQHADRVVEETADFMRAGMTEREVARFALRRFEDLGDTEPWAIVASGPNASLPHHFTSDRRLAEGEVVILDVGAYTGGYGSDITRTYWLGEPTDEARRVYALVDEAQRAGVAAARAGAACESVDRAARAVIERGGYGEFFIHRTGHGVGLEVHEPPYLVAGNPMPLAAGMTHSVEPGIYLPGRFGIRIEDLVVVEDTRARPLNEAPRDLRPPRLRR